MTDATTWLETGAVTWVETCAVTCPVTLRVGAPVWAAAASSTPRTGGGHRAAAPR